MPEILGIQDGSKDASVTLEVEENFLLQKKTFTSVYQVLADTTTQNEDDILLTTGLPSLGLFLNGCYCVSVNPTEEQTIIHPETGVTSILWLVTCEFDSNIDSDQADKDPKSLRPQRSWGAEMVNEVIEEDQNDQEVMTKAEERIILTAPRALPSLSITRYEAWPFNPNTILDYTNHTNTGTFYGAPKGTALMKSITATEEVINDVLLQKVTYKIVFDIREIGGGGKKQDTWVKQVLHTGHQYWKKNPALFPADPDTIILKAKDRDENPMEVRLNDWGGLLANGAPAVYLTFRVYDTANFTTLGLEY